MTDNWESFFRQMNESYSEALERNLDAQAEFVETWTESLDGEQMEDGVEGVARAYEAWMDAAEEAVELTEDAAAGEADPAEFRDLWLDAANTAFKRVMGTSAFAAATGQALDDALEVQAELDEAAQDTVREYGFATSDDVEEVGERLVELERRQHAVEQKLDEVLERLE